MKRSHKNKSRNKWKKGGGNKKHPNNNENRKDSVKDSNAPQQERKDAVAVNVADKAVDNDSRNSLPVKDNSLSGNETQRKFKPQQNMNDKTEPTKKPQGQYQQKPYFKGKKQASSHPRFQKQSDNKPDNVNSEPKESKEMLLDDSAVPQNNLKEETVKETGFLKSDWLLLRMRKAGRNYVCKNNFDLNIKLGDVCVVDLGRAEDYAKVLNVKTPTDDEIKNSIAKKIKRLMTDKDRQRVEDNKAKEEYAYQKCLRRIADHKLNMKLVGVEYSLDCSRIIFYFTADGRVDFRELVKSLASEFRARIELRQIGVRDESKMLGGLGCCGRKLCCSTFLYNFEPINIRMAKIQRLPLNPSKISGLCGRLHCCLRYEYKFYRKASKGMPREGSLVSTKSGEGRIFDINILKRVAFVFLENGKILEVPVSEIKILKEQKEVEPDKKLMKSMITEQVDVQELKKLEDFPDSDVDDDDDDDDDDF